MKRTLQFAALILVVGFVLPLHAQQPSAEQRAAGKELRTSMRAWFKASVYPTLTEWKRTYDATLSSSDLAALNALRAEATQLKASMKHATKDERHAAKKSLVDRVKPIAMSSKDALRATLTNGKPQIEKWRAEAKAIVDQWQAMYPNAKMHGGGHHHMGLLNADDSDGKKAKRAAIRFMLWDGQVPNNDKADSPFLAPDDSDATTGTDDDDATSSRSMTVAPTPVEHTASVNVKGLTDGPATIDVFDMNGTLVRSIPTTVVAGAIDQRIDVSGLTAGTYMASVNTQRGRRTTQLVVHR